MKRLSDPNSASAGSGAPLWIPVPGPLMSATPTTPLKSKMLDTSVFATGNWKKKGWPPIVVPYGIGFGAIDDRLASVISGIQTLDVTITPPASPVADRN